MTTLRTTLRGTDRSGRHRAVDPPGGTRCSRETSGLSTPPSKTVSSFLRCVVGVAVLLASMFDSTRGYPGEGPQRQVAHVRRDALEQPRLSAQGLRGRTRATDRFRRHVTDCNVDPELLARSPLLLAGAWRAYGRRLCEDGWPYYLFVEAILGVRDRYPHVRHELAFAHRWADDEPLEHRLILPVSAVRALAGLALAWRWWTVAAYVLLGFAEMLRPCEFLLAKRRSLFLLRDLLEGEAAFLTILAPKTRRLYKRQHVKIDQRLLVDFLEALYGRAEGDAYLLVLGPVAFRSRWDAVVSLCGLGEMQGNRKITPACLRGSGATALCLRLWRPTSRRQHAALA